MDGVEFWLARSDVFITISQVEDQFKGFYLLDALSSNAYHVLAAFVKHGYDDFDVSGFAR